MFTTPEINLKHSRAVRGQLTVAMLTILIGASTGTIHPAKSYSAGRQLAAHTARSLNANATAHLRLIRAEGSQLFEEGEVSGALKGWMRAELKTSPVFTGSFTTRTHDGVIKGHGSAKPHGAGRYQSFSGSFVVTGGTRRYAHAKGRAGLYGVFDRRTDRVVVQTTGKLSY
jgi:hypothetical protein